MLVFFPVDMGLVSGEPLNPSPSAWCPNGSQMETILGFNSIETPPRQASLFNHRLLKREAKKAPSKNDPEAAHCMILPRIACLRVHTKLRRRFFEGTPLFVAFTGKPKGNQSCFFGFLILSQTQPFSFPQFLNLELFGTPFCVVNNSLDFSDFFLSHSLSK